MNSAELRAPLCVPKVPTGIDGLDQITAGGLPEGRATLVCGGAGCGKTMLGAQFLARGAMQHGEPGVLVLFEESPDELAQNLLPIGIDLDALRRTGLIFVDHVQVERSQIDETGEYDLEGLFIRLEHAVQAVGARRVVLDTIEALFSSLPSEAVLRAELRRLFRWLKDRGLTAVVTGEQGVSTLTRHGLEEYVADCVILLDHQVKGQVSTRRLRIVKYRGSPHGTNEYPFLIGEEGLSVLPITSLRLDHRAFEERVSTGVVGLDDMLGGRGVFRGTSVLVSGSPGTGKSSLAASFAHAACSRGEKALLFTYEESASQLFRNARSIGLDLAQYERDGLLHVHAVRPTLQGLEEHLVLMHDIVRRVAPDVVAVDPISNFTLEMRDPALRPMLIRLIDFLKHRGITALFTSLTNDTALPLAETEIGVSSLMDTWFLLSNRESNGERTRLMQVVKSRGMAHSNQIREFVIGDHGVALIEVFVEGRQVLTGLAREQASRQALQKRQPARTSP